MPDYIPTSFPDPVQQQLWAATFGFDLEYDLGDVASVASSNDTTVQPCDSISQVGQPAVVRNVDAHEYGPTIDPALLHVRDECDVVRDGATPARAIVLEDNVAEERLMVAMVADAEYEDEGCEDTPLSSDDEVRPAIR